MHIDVSAAAFYRLVTSRGALLAGAPLILALTLGAPSQALAACGGTTGTTGAHAASTGSGGTHSGATTPHVSSSSGTSCSATAATNPTPLAGVHEPGEAPKQKHASLSGVHTGTHTTNNSQHSLVHKTGSSIKS